MTEQRTKDERACCAHLRVKYATEQELNGLTRGWWECFDCRQHFAPVPREPLSSEQRPLEPGLIIIDAQHDETGRWWRGARGALPRGYTEVTAPLPSDERVCAHGLNRELVECAQCEAERPTWWADGNDICTTDADGLPVLVAKVYNERDVGTVLNALRAADVVGVDKR